MEDKRKILIVDDEIVLAKVVSKRLNYLGYDTHIVNSGIDALKYLETDTADLAILDLLMPQMDGYETARRIRADEKNANLPIIMLTAKVSRETKITALKLGIDDFMTKPYDQEELAARIESVLRRAQPTIEGGKPAEFKTIPINAKEKKRIEFLKMIQDKEVPYINPEYDMTNPTGYTWKLAKEFFDTKNGNELEELNYLESKGVLESRFYDKILTCPFCAHHNLNLREVDPVNHSADIVLAPTIHHYPCGYVGIELEFLDGLNYVCPKCNKELKSIGVDYDKPGRMYFSNETGEKFTEPDVICECRNCQREFDAADAVRQNIYAFVPTDKLGFVVSEGRFVQVNFEQELFDQDINLYNLNYFRQKFREEFTRSEQFNRPLSLVLAEIKGLEAIVADKGEVHAQDILKELTLILKESLWKVDVPARYDKNAFISLLPEADKNRAIDVINEIKKVTEKRISADITLELRSVSYPEDGTTRDELFEALIAKNGR